MTEWRDEIEGQKLRPARPEQPRRRLVLGRLKAREGIVLTLCRDRRPQGGGEGEPDDGGAAHQSSASFQKR